MVQDENNTRRFQHYMTAIITIKDTSLQGAPSSSWQLTLLEETSTSTLREVIRSRIYQEVSEYNARKRSQHLYLITLPPTASSNPTEIAPIVDWQLQYERAITAFEQKRYIVLVDDRQVSDLDRSIQITTKSTITFLKLVPLIGG
jgi:hypothetical protein